MTIDARVTEDRTITFNDATGDLDDVEGDDELLQLIANLSYSDARELMGSAVTPEDIAELEGNIRDALEALDRVNYVADVTVEDVTDGKLELHISVDSDEIEGAIRL
jgi:hypothetical protein